jgi:hypothetical protein
MLMGGCLHHNNILMPWLVELTLLSPRGLTTTSQREKEVLEEKRRWKVMETGGSVAGKASE